MPVRIKFIRFESRDLFFYTACKWPETIPNGMYELGPSNATTFKNTVKYTCDAGFALHGDQTLQCNETGQWNKPTPNCNGEFVRL